VKTLRLASFGIRGFAGESLDPRVLIDFAAAFATFIDGRRVLLGRDTRYSSPMLHSAVVAGLLSAGCEILDFGVCPTPVLQFSVGPHGAAGAVSISGGHNAMGWNAVTLIGPDGAFLEPMGGEYVLDCFHARDFLEKDAGHLGERRDLHDYFSPYLETLGRAVNREAIGRAGFTVLIDPVGGAGCSFLEPFARSLGVRYVPINATPTGYLAREPEPRPRSAQQMASIIKHLDGDVGFVHSSDMGRMSVVTEEGEPLSEELTFALIADHRLRRRAGTLVTNCCTTRCLDDLAAAAGASIVKTPVGQAHVVARLIDEQGLLGGEGSGSVCDPGFSRAFDGFLMMALILEAMAEGGTRVSELARKLPRYHIVKKSVICGSREGYRALDAVKQRLAGQSDTRVDYTDGLRLDWEDGWLHVRASRTQQLIRVISEARTRARAEQRAESAIRLVEGVL
jgi:phosphomannomutase